MSDGTSPPSIMRLDPPSWSDSSVNGHAPISIVEPGRLAFLAGQIAFCDQTDGN